MGSARTGWSALSRTIDAMPDKEISRSAVDGFSDVPERARLRRCRQAARWRRLGDGHSHWPARSDRTAGGRVATRLVWLVDHGDRQTTAGDGGRGGDLSSADRLLRWLRPDTCSADE